MNMKHAVRKPTIVKVCALFNGLSEISSKNGHYTTEDKTAIVKKLKVAVCYFKPARLLGYVQKLGQGKYKIENGRKFEPIDARKIIEKSYQMHIMHNLELKRGEVKRSELKAVPMFEKVGAINEKAAIKFLKSRGYKIMKAETKYFEV